MIVEQRLAVCGCEQLHHYYHCCLCICSAVADATMFATDRHHVLFILVCSITIFAPSSQLGSLLCWCDDVMSLLACLCVGIVYSHQTLDVVSYNQ
jgi:hypothetical protein